MEQISNIKLQREFYLGFSDSPQKFINEWLASQSRDLKVIAILESYTTRSSEVFVLQVMKDSMGNTESQRKAAFYDQLWCTDAVPRYFYAKVSQRKSELDAALGIRHP